MKYTVKIIALLISIVMLLSQLVSCTYLYEYITRQQNNYPVIEEDDGIYVFEVIYPQISVSSLKFELGDGDLERFESKLRSTKALYVQGEGTSEDRFRDALYELLTLEAYISTQCDIAYVQYWYDTSDPEAWDNYLYAYEIRDEAHDLFWGFYAQVKNKDDGLAQVFREVVESEYGGNLVSVTTEADDYAYKMELLKGEYNTLQNENASDSIIFEVYKEYMIAAQGLANASYTENYYEYASKYLYYRDDTHEQREIFREYTKQYLIPLYYELKAQSEKYDSKLTDYEFDMSNKYLQGKYDTFSKNYLVEYFSSLAASSGEAMINAFEKDRVIIGDMPASYDTAMVTTVGNTPICYFHEELTTLDTMSHELGHYYAREVGDSEYYSYSLKETHSTANTMLFFSYLSNEIGTRAFKSAEKYLVSNWIYQTVLSVIKDEFDEIVYTSDSSSLTISDFNRIMNELMDEYGARDMSDNIEEQLLTYWKRQGTLYPVSNYCYAIAFTASLQIYLESKTDYDTATEIYRKIVEEVDGEGEFLATIQKAGLTTPYDEQTYIKLNSLVGLR